MLETLISPGSLPKASSSLTSGGLLVKGALSKAVIVAAVTVPM